MGKGIARLGDIGDGADGHNPRRNTQGSPDVFVNGIAVHRIGDFWPVHFSGESSHSSVLAEGSITVFANGKGIGRIGDSQNCGANVAQGSLDVFAG